MASKKASQYPIPLDSDLLEYVETVRHLVRFADVIEDELPCDVARFGLLRNIAIYEVMFGLTVAETGEQVEMSEGGVRKIRQTPLYRRIRELVELRARDVASGGDMMELSETLEPVFAAEMLHSALRGQGRDKLKALDEFTGRMSSKRGREVTTTVRLPPAMEEAILAAREVQRRAALPEGDVIDAEVVRRPDD